MDHFPYHTRHSIPLTSFLPPLTSYTHVYSVQRKRVKMMSALGRKVVSITRWLHDSREMVFWIRWRGGSGIKNRTSVSPHSGPMVLIVAFLCIFLHYVTVCFGHVLHFIWCWWGQQWWRRRQGKTYGKDEKIKVAKIDDNYYMNMYVCVYIYIYVYDGDEFLIQQQVLIDNEWSTRRKDRHRSPITNIHDYDNRSNDHADHHTLEPVELGRRRTKSMMIG